MTFLFLLKAAKILFHIPPSFRKTITLNYHIHFLLRQYVESSEIQNKQLLHAVKISPRQTRQKLRCKKSDMPRVHDNTREIKVVVLFNGWHTRAMRTIFATRNRNSLLNSHI